MQQQYPLLEELLEAGIQQVHPPLLDELLEAGTQHTTQHPLLLEELAVGQHPLLLEELLEAAPQDENGAHA
jgi:hypothetical protein